mgnify:CR=1 FL=1
MYHYAVKNMYRPLLFTIFLFAAIAAPAQNKASTPYTGLPVYFDFGADTLTAKAEGRLKQLADDIRELPGLEVRLAAHTDAIGSAEANVALSGRRAQAVSAMLAAAGVPDSTIQYVKQGEAAPVADNSTPEGRQQNRRVEVTVFSALPMRELTGQIQEENGGEGVPATVLLSTPTWSDSLQTDTAGRFQTVVPALEKVRIDAFAKGFFFDTKIVPPDTGRSKVAMVLPLPRAEKGVALPVKRLHFLGDRAILRAKSIPELDRLMRFLQVNDGMHISIHGHVNVPNTPPVAEATAEFQLSVRRARHIYEFLVNKGIDPERLSYEGHGNSMMLYPRARSEGQQAANRRVEVRVE